MKSTLQVYEIHLLNQNGPLPLTAVRAHSLNGLFYTTLGQKFPALVEQLHQASKPMPFSLAPIFGEEQFLGIRIATLEPELGERVAETWGTLAARGAEVRLGSATLRIEAIRPGRPDATTYEELFAAARAAHGLRLRFETPVRLKLHGQSSVLPAPQSVWQNYAKKWEAHSSISLPFRLVQWVSHRVHVTELALQTCYAYVEQNVEWKGVMGEVEYQAFSADDDHNVPALRVPDYLRAWQALALFAEFSGTGEKTTMGMGQTRRITVYGKHRSRP